jgi:hypothetical protein
MAVISDSTSTSAAVVTYVDVRAGIVQWSDAQVQILLDYNSKNQEFSDQFALTESFAFLLARAVIDSFTITDSPNIQNNKIVTDSVSFGDAQVITMHWGLAITDSVTIQDTIIDEHTDGTIINEFVFNSECFLSRPITAPNVIISLS